MIDLMPFTAAFAFLAAGSIALLSNRRGKWPLVTFWVAFGCYAADIAQPINNRVFFYVALGVVGLVDCLHRARQLRGWN
jgi:hypothetical protein